MPQRGVSISGVCFSDADYVDDVATIEGSPGDLAETLARIEEASSELGLHISWSKTKMQSIGAGPVGRTGSTNQRAGGGGRGQIRLFGQHGLFHRWITLRADA